MVETEHHFVDIEEFVFFFEIVVERFPKDCTGHCKLGLIVEARARAVAIATLYITVCSPDFHRVVSAVMSVCKA